MKTKVILIVLMYLLFTVELRSDRNRIVIGRCDYINYTQVGGNGFGHAGDCNYHLRLEEERHKDIIKKLDEIKNKLK